MGRRCSVSPPPVSHALRALRFSCVSSRPDSRSSYAGAVQEAVLLWMARKLSRAGSSDLQQRPCSSLTREPPKPSFELIFQDISVARVIREQSS
eukprot:76952-Pleurochrysis_carterae.AAC.1